MQKVAFVLPTGFLPTYGPSFIHFYGSGSVEKNGCSGKCLTAMPLYRGRVLLSLKTEMDDLEASPGIGVETVPAFPIIEVIRFVVMLRSSDYLFYLYSKSESLYGKFAFSIVFYNSVKVFNVNSIYFITLVKHANLIF